MVTQEQLPHGMFLTAHWENNRHDEQQIRVAEEEMSIRTAW